MKKSFRKEFDSRWLRPAFVAFSSSLVLASAAFVQATGQSPWENAVSVLQQAFTSMNARGCLWLRLFWLGSRSLSAKVARIVFLDYELKRNLNRDLALLGPEKDDPDRKSQVAEKHHLQVVNGKIPVPDLRAEYETPELELPRVDMELATRDYRPRAMAEKASAGFSLYGRSEAASRLRRVLDEREITAGILTL